MRVKLKHRRLAIELAKKNLTLNGWARRLGIGNGHLWQLVNGKRPYPHPKTRLRLLEALDVQFEELFEVSFLDDKETS